MNIIAKSDTAIFKAAIPKAAREIVIILDPIKLQRREW